VEAAKTYLAGNGGAEKAEPTKDALSEALDMLGAKPI
jgi:hypothetical protein